MNKGASRLTLDRRDRHAHGGAALRDRDDFQLHAEIVQHPLEPVRPLQTVEEAGGFLIEDQFGDALAADMGRQHHLVRAGLQ